MWLTPTTTKPWLASSSASVAGSDGGNPLGESASTGRMPGGSLHPFCGWIDLLAVLERVATGAEPPHDDPAAVA